LGGNPIPTAGARRCCFGIRFGRSIMMERIQSVFTYFSQQWLTQGLILWFLFFVLIWALSWKYLNYPYYWDGLWYVAPETMEIYQTGSPFLYKLDVGHPTAYFVTAAGFMKILGPYPSTARILSWMFAALMATSVYGLGRILELPKPVALGVALLTLFFPLCWANTQLILLDMPLFSATMAAFYFWGRERWFLYFLAGSYAVLVKLMGFVPFAALAAATIIGSGPFWQKGRRGPFLGSLAKTLSPFVSLAIFLFARLWIRGPEWTVNFTQSISLIPIWHPRKFISHFTYSYNMFYDLTMMNWLVALTFIVGALALMQLRREVSKRRDFLKLLFFPQGSNQRFRLIWALFFLPMAMTGAFFQMSVSQCPRYVLSIIPAFLLLFILCVWFLCQKQFFVLFLQAFMCSILIILWHPNHARYLPAPLNRWLERRVETQDFLLEIDLRFIDVIDLIKWGGEEIMKDVSLYSSTIGVVTGKLFINEALAAPEHGYVSTPIPNISVDNWNDVDVERFPYVFSLRPLTYFSPPPVALFDSRLVAKKTSGHVKAAIWHITRKKTLLSKAEEQE
jgi:4-amino-4-deoxy-L-arabinose transferase-like glycosyltransferase